jgi:hypothetical protein
MSDGIQAISKIRSGSAWPGRRQPDRFPVSGASGFERSPALGGSCLQTPKPPSVRVAMTLRAINHARHLAIVAAGLGKAAVSSRVKGKTIGW